MYVQVWLDVYTLPVPGTGGKTCSQIFEEAGCDTPASPSCGACLGGPKDTYARMNEAQASYFPFLFVTHMVMFFYFQDGNTLPNGPVVISPDGLFPSLYREGEVFLYIFLFILIGFIILHPTL